MRLVSSKTLLTLATALVAVPGAAIAAAEPGEPLLQVAASDTDEIDCEELLEAPEDEGTDGEDAFEAQELPEECEDDEAGADADADGDGTDGTTEEDEESTGDDGSDEGGDEVTGEDADEEGAESPTTEDTEEVDDDAHGEIVSAVAACAPRGQERVDGFDLPNHGAYVSAAAKGEMLAVGDGEYDLSALEDATALCDDLDAARADAEAPAADGTDDAGDPEADGTEETNEVETSGADEPAPERDGPAGPATGQQQDGASGPSEQAGNRGGGKGPQRAPGRNR